jgi:hypothetical protein
LGSICGDDGRRDRRMPVAKSADLNPDIAGT